MAAPNRRRPRTGEGLGVRVSPPNRYSKRVCKDNRVSCPIAILNPLWKAMAAPNRWRPSPSTPFDPLRPPSTPFDPLRPPSTELRDRLRLAQGRRSSGQAELRDRLRLAQGRRSCGTGFDWLRAGGAAGQASLRELQKIKPPKRS